MDKDKKLLEIFENDPLGLLNIKHLTSPSRNEDERLIESFQELNIFFSMNNREPELGGGIQEHQLYSRLKSLRLDATKIEKLRIYDKYGLLKYEQKSYNSLDDIFGSDYLGLLNDDSEGLFDLKHIEKEDERANADFIARRKPCKSFQKYETQFKEVQADLSSGKRKLIGFKEENLRVNGFYVHNGILLYLEKVKFEKDVYDFKSGSRERKDGRTRVIFENGTESNMLYRSLYKALISNGKVVTENADKINLNFIKNFSNVTEEDEETGFIYILKSKSEKQEIKEMLNLYKIGFSKIDIEERVKGANLDPTFLLADVRIVMTYKCFNLNPQKFELLLHNFFGKACLNVDVFDKEGNRHIPREWFIAPITIIEQAVHLIISGDIIKFRYDPYEQEVVAR